jgi:hypothetical protein
MAEQIIIEELLAVLDALKVKVREYREERCSKPLIDDQIHRCRADEVESLAAIDHVYGLLVFHDRRGSKNAQAVPKETAKAG